MRSKLVLFMVALSLGGGIGLAGVQGNAPYITVNAQGQMFICPLQQPNDEPDQGYNRFLAVAKRLGVGPADLLRAFAQYLAVETKTGFNRPTQEAITDAQRTSGLELLLASEGDKGLLPKTPINQYLKGGAVEPGKSVDCGICSAGEVPAKACGANTCAKGCGNFSGTCYATGAIFGRGF